MESACLEKNKSEYKKPYGETIKQQFCNVNLLASVKNGMTELQGLYFNSKYRSTIFICHFSFFVSSLTYYVIGKHFGSTSNEIFYIQRSIISIISF